jgi:ribosome-binding factor A
MARHRHHHRDQSAGGSARQLRVGELIRHALAEMLVRGDIHDPVIETHMITVPEVRMSPDLRIATIYVTPLGGRGEEEVLAALDNNKRYVRGEISRRVNLKFAPEIRFRIDERFDEAERIGKLLQTPAVQRDLHGDHSHDQALQDQALQDQALQDQASKGPDLGGEKDD